MPSLICSNEQIRCRFLVNVGAIRNECFFHLEINWAYPTFPKWLAVCSQDRPILPVEPAFLALMHPVEIGKITGYV